jgi:hypothetical protein
MSNADSMMLLASDVVFMPFSHESVTMNGIQKQIYSKTWQIVVGKCVAMEPGALPQPAGAVRSPNCLGASNLGASCR